MELLLIGVILTVMCFLASFFGSYFGSRAAWTHLLYPQGKDAPNIPVDVYNQQVEEYNQQVDAQEANNEL